MKRFFFLMMLFTSLFANAQHLSFMGIPMGGDINDFAKLLEAKGHRIAYSGSLPDKDWITLTGDFWIFSDADIYLRAAYIDKGTTEIIVEFRPNRGEYAKLVTSLDSKYGKHRTQKNVNYSGDLVCYWHTKRGDIKLSRTQYYDEGDARCNSSLTYYDYPFVKRMNAKKKARANDL